MNPLAWLWNQIKAEPVAFVAVVQSVLALMLTFGLRLTIEQTGAIIAVTQVVLAFFTRRAVTANVNLLPQPGTPQ